MRKLSHWRWISSFLGIVIFCLVALQLTPALGFEKKPETIVFAGGCYWCMQPPFDYLLGKGVLSVRVGFAGGSVKDPSYEQVSNGGTGHREVVEVQFSPEKIKVEKLLEVFWKNVDPLDEKGQFCDKGEQYTTAIYLGSETQRRAAEISLSEVKEKLKAKGEVRTMIFAPTSFYPAEAYHQSYYKNNPVRYKFYRFNCGRDKRLNEVWSH